MRGLAALSVLIYHVTFYYRTPGTVLGYLTGRVTGEPYPAVVVFFVISGFVLYRPFAKARLAGADSPALLPYFVRRLARVVPAYWLALTITAVMLGMHYVFTVPGVVRYYGFLQIYQPFYPTRGIGPAWTLCVEVTFYLALPLIALSVRRLAARSSFLGSELTLCGMLWLLSVGWQLVILQAKPSGWWELSLLFVLPGTLGLFATGMALAALSLVLEQRTEQPSWVEFIDRFPWLSWVAALGLLYFVGRLGHVAYTHYELWWLVTGMLKAGSALLFLAPLVFGNARRDLMRRVLGSRPLLFLGTISYGFYLWHLPLLMELQSVLVPHGEVFTDITLLAVTIAVAAASYYLLEQPLQRLARGWLSERQLGTQRDTAGRPISTDASGVTR